MRKISSGWLLSVIMLALGGCSASSSDSTTLPDAPTAEILQKAWGKAMVLLTLGPVQFVNDRTLSNTQIPISQYPLYQAIASMNLIRLENERDLSGDFTNWDDFFLLTQAGVRRVATVTLLPEGERVGAVPTLKDNPTLKEKDLRIVFFVCGESRIERVISNELIELNGERYRQVVGTHVFEFKPGWRDACLKNGEQDYRERRFRTLLKYDPIDSSWRHQTSDLGPRHVDFQSANVPKAIANLRSAGAR